jgi:hypothetical protein
MSIVIADLPSGRDLSATLPDGMIPLFTRHTRGVIEAERDARRRHRRDRNSTFRYRSSGSGSHDATHGAPFAAVGGNARVVAQASPDVDRWTDEGGSYHADVVARLRVIPSRR